MGKATRWLKSLFTSKKDNNDDNNREEITTNATMCHNPATIPPNISPTEVAWLRSYYLETEKEKSKHAIAVAAATAAAADAAIVAAHAAVAVVKLTSNGRWKESASVLLQNCRERHAAVRIQSVFRGYLARKALRALRSLVKLQAVVRGFLVRKQAAATLRSMQALVRAQATVMSRRSEIASRKSLDNLDVRSVHSRRFSSTFEAMVDERAKIVVIDTSIRPKSSSKSRSRRNNLSISESMIKDQSHYCSTRLSPLTHAYDWGLNGDECKFSSAHSTPKFSTKRGASEWAMNPSYMANTHSFRAKVRSHSAPRQRSSDGMIKRRVSLLEMMDARNSVSHPSVSFKNAVMRKIDRAREEFGE